MSVEDHAARVLDLVARIPPGRVLAYGDIAQRLGGLGPRTVGTVMSRYGSDVPWWRVIRSDGRPPQGLESEAFEHWRAEGTPMVGGLVEGGRADMARARWEDAPAARPGGSRGALHHVEIWAEDIEAAGREWGWLLERLGYQLGDDWGHGRAWELGSLYLVVEAGPDVEAGSPRATTPGGQSPCLPWWFACRGRCSGGGLRLGRLDADVCRPSPVCRWARSLRRLPRERGGLRGRARRRRTAPAGAVSH